MAGQAWPLLRWMLLAQCALTLVAAAIVVALLGPMKGVFVIVGGGFAMVLSALAAMRSFAVDAASDPDGALRALRRGVSIKFIAAIVLFAAAAKWLPQYVAQIIIGFAAATVSYWIALLRAPLGPAAGQHKGQQS